MDLDTVIAEVAAAVGLAEGEPGVRDVLRVIAAAEPVPARELGRQAELPVPIVTAVCNELRQRGVVDRTRPVRLTAGARELLGGGRPLPAARCPDCGGRGIAIPAGLAPLAAELELAAATAPEAKPELDQTHCTVPTKISRVLLMQETGALAGQRILLLGDDDLVSVAIARFAAITGLAGAATPAAQAAPAAGLTRIRRLAVVDTDPDVLSCIADQAAGTGLEVELTRHDLRQPLPDALRGGFDVVCTDPPYTVPGAELFLSRAVAALEPGPGRHLFFSFGARRPAETLRTQQLIAGLGLTVRAMLPGFNEYLGAGILSGTSNLYHLRTTVQTAPLISEAYDGPLYTADTRPVAVRPYRCAGCAAVHEVGPGARWSTIAVLQADGCPQCGGTTFRPMPRQERSGQQPGRQQADRPGPGRGQPDRRRR
jgi:predicted methyltransferase